MGSHLQHSAHSDTSRLTSPNPKMIGLDDVGVAGDRGAGLGGGRCGGRDRRRLASVPTRTERERDPLPGLRLQKPGRVPGNQDPALGER